MNKLALSAMVLMAIVIAPASASGDKPDIVVTRVAAPPEKAPAPAPRTVDSQTIHSKKGDVTVTYLLPQQDDDPPPAQPSLIIQRQRGLLTLTDSVHVTKRVEGPPPSPKAAPKAPPKQAVYVVDSKVDKDVRIGIVAPAPAPTPKAAPAKVTRNTKEEAFANSVAG